MFSLLISYNITISWINLLKSFRFIVSLRDSETIYLSLDKSLLLGEFYSYTKLISGKNYEAFNIKQFWYMGYWPSLFGQDGWILAKFFFGWSRSINSETRTRRISSHLDRTSLVNKGFILWLSAKYYSPPCSRGKPKWLLSAYCHKFGYSLGR